MSIIKFKKKKKTSKERNLRNGGQTKREKNVPLVPVNLESWSCCENISFNAKVTFHVE